MPAIAVLETKLASATSALRLESPRVVIREIRREDLEQMQTWPPFREPLHRLWDLPRRTPLSRDIWFMVYSSDPARMWYAIERRADGELIGALSLREIVKPTSARLGIRLGADFVDRGYGSEALRLFLPHYFRTLGFERLLLDVAATNRRAIHVYEKLGFRRIDQHYRNVPKEQDLSFLDQEPYRHLRLYFRRHFGRMQLVFYDMVLERSEWEKQATEQGTELP
jgi:RimJ/RimL family protein N-acetyltransferase